MTVEQNNVMMITFANIIVHCKCIAIGIPILLLLLLSYHPCIVRSKYMVLTALKTCFLNEGMT